jgi:hypothetical protein
MDVTATKTILSDIEFAQLGGGHLAYIGKLIPTRPRS